MGFLKDSHCYLSGAIEQDKLRGINWRHNVIKTLTNKFQVKVFDPNADPKQNKIPELLEAKKNGDLPTIQRIASAFVRKDLAKVDRTDFVIARIAYENVYFEEDVKDFEVSCHDEKVIPTSPHLRQVPTTGTIHEIINADLYHKPTLIVCEHGAHMIPSWLIGFLPIRYLFGSWTDLFHYLQEVDEGKCKEDERWSYVYGLV